MSEGKVQSCDLGKIKEKFKRDYPKVISRNGQDGQDRTFAPKQNERDCPMTRQSYIYLCTLMVTKADVQAFMAERSEYTKANRFEDIEVKVYI